MAGPSFLFLSGFSSLFYSSRGVKFDPPQCESIHHKRSLIIVQHQVETMEEMITGQTLLSHKIIIFIRLFFVIYNVGCL